VLTSGIFNFAIVFRLLDATTSHISTIASASATILDKTPPIYSNLPVSPGQIIWIAILSCVVSIASKTALAR